jgi:uncharacterized protein
VDVTATGPERDRDAAGRPRNARPRDSLGRPLARDAVGQPVMPDGLDVTPDWALSTAQQLLDDDRPFHAHEVLEAAWKSAPPAERNLWQGLAQLAVGLTHALRGNGHGATALLRRGAVRVRGYAGSCPHGIAVDDIVRAANALADRIESGGLAGLGPADLTLRLTAEPGPPSG